jgi:hypothetical protein
MLRYEAITFIQDVEVHDLYIDLASLIWVTASNFSYTPPSCVPLVNNCFAYEGTPINVALEYLQDALMWSVGSQAEACCSPQYSFVSTGSAAETLSPALLPSDTALSLKCWAQGRRFASGHEDEWPAAMAA